MYVLRKKSMNCICNIMYKLLYLKSPKVRGIKVWEMLPANVQKAPTIFKVKFKNFIKLICNVH